MVKLKRYYKYRRYTRKGETLRSRLGYWSDGLWVFEP